MRSSLTILLRSGGATSLTLVLASKIDLFRSGGGIGPGAANSSSAIPSNTSISRLSSVGANFCRNQNLKISLTMTLKCSLKCSTWLICATPNSFSLSLMVFRNSLFTFTRAILSMISSSELHEPSSYTRRICLWTTSLSMKRFLTLVFKLFQRSLGLSTKSRSRLSRIRSRYLLSTLSPPDPLAASSVDELSFIPSSDLLRMTG